MMDGCLSLVIISIVVFSFGSFYLFSFFLEDVLPYDSSLCDFFLRSGGG